MVSKSTYDIIREIAYFEGCKVIFLGQYGIYERIIEVLKLKNYINIYHPAYLRYSNKVDIESERIDLLNFLENK